VQAAYGPTDMLRYVFRYKYSILITILIALLCLIPSSSIPYSSLFYIPHIDKIVHFSMYAPLGFVALMESRIPRQYSRNHLYIMIVIFLLSGIIEILQATLVSSRAAEWADLLANLIGLLTGYLAFRLLGGFRIFRFLKF
jgi:VanZ family protein